MSKQVILDVLNERVEQDRKWGEQNHPDGTEANNDNLDTLAAIRGYYEDAEESNTLTWRHILEEEVAEVFASGNPRDLRRELVQVAAVAVAWIEAIDRRGD
jgi:hypothetical protein